MKILITGVAGFIGSHLAEKLLSLGHSIIGIDNFDNFYDSAIKKNNLKKSSQSEHFSFYEIDIRTTEAFNNIQNLKFDFVIHLAAKAGIIPSIKDPDAYINTNIIGTHNLLKFMLKINCTKLIFASSSSVYGNSNIIPFNENDKVDHPLSPYSFTKKTCELLNYNYHLLNNFNILNFRFFTVYGPRQRPDLAIHKFFHLAYQNKPIIIYGNGDSARDYTYISDITNGIIAGIDYINTNSNIYEIINLGNNNPIKLNNLVDSIEKVIQKKIQREYRDSREGELHITFANIEKAKRLLNYQPLTKMEEGLNNFKEWYDKTY